MIGYMYIGNEKHEQRSAPKISRNTRIFCRSGDIYAPRTRGERMIYSISLIQNEGLGDY
jgi:hypothetical protein